MKRHVRQFAQPALIAKLASIILCHQLSIAALAAPVESTKVSPTTIDERHIKQAKDLNKLLAEMTLEEKLGQLNLLSVGTDVTGPVMSKGVEEKIASGQVGGVFNLIGPSAVRKLQQMVMEKSRLKIPLFFGYDVIHGYRTIFPIPLGLSSSWNLDLIERTASAAASEASADAINWTFSPMVDITRDPRWGRVCEGSGEDTYLGSRIAEAMVRGYQGDGSYERTNKIMACVKHFALYGAAEAGRDYNTVDMSRWRMYNEYLPPYKAAVDAGVASVMTSFNEVDGVPATGNKWLMTDLLRKQWNFGGFIATDYTAIPEMIAHGVGDEKKVSELALNAGVDMDMVGELFTKYGAELVRSGQVSEAQINAACMRVLAAKSALGLFDDPYRHIDGARKSEIMSADKIALSKEAAIKSMVLLKNDNKTLPVSAAQKVAVIGPFVKDQRNLIGSWSANGQGKEAVSIWSALQNRFGDNMNSGKIRYAKGCNILDDAKLIERLNRDGAELTIDKQPSQHMIDEAVALAKDSDVVVAVLGEPFAMSGEAASRSSISLFDNQLELLKALKTTGKPVALVLMNGRPLDLSWADQNVDAILETWYGGTTAGTAISDVIFGDANPSGKLTMTFPRNLGQVPIYYASKNTGRPYVPNEKFHSQYLDVPNSPLYPFGHGLSYTNFKYGTMKLDKKVVNADEQVNVTVDVTNTGDREGVETVQLYVRDVVGSITRPVKQLKSFKQVALKPGETKTISFSIAEPDLRFYNSDLKLVSEPGDFKVFVGTSSSDCSEASFRLQ